MDIAKPRTTEEIMASFGVDLSPKQPKGLSEFGKGVRAFVDETQAIGGGLVGLAATGAQKIMPDSVDQYLEPVKQWGLDTFQSNMEESTAGRQAPKIARIEDIKLTEEGGLGRLGDWAAYQLPKGLGTVAEIGLSGGIGAAIAKGAVKEGVKEVAKGALVKQAIKNVGEQGLKGQAAKEAIGVAVGKTAAAQQAVRQATTTGAKVGASAGAFGMEAGSAFGGAVEAGAAPDNSVLPAITAGAINAALELTPWGIAAKYLGVDKVAGRAIGQAIKNDAALSKRAVQLAKKVTLGATAGVVVEGVTEGMQELVQLAGERWAKEDPVFKGLTADDWSRITNAAAAGALTGGVLGAGAGPFQNYAAQAKPPSEGDTAAKSAMDKVPPEGPVPAPEGTPQLAPSALGLPKPTTPETIVVEPGGAAYPKSQMADGFGPISEKSDKAKQPPLAETMQEQTPVQEKTSVEAVAPVEENKPADNVTPQSDKPVGPSEQAIYDAIIAAENVTQQAKKIGSEESPAEVPALPAPVVDPQKEEVAAQQPVVENPEEQTVTFGDETYTVKGTNDGIQLHHPNGDLAYNAASIEEAKALWDKDQATSTVPPFVDVLYTASEKGYLDPLYVVEEMNATEVEKEALTALIETGTFEDAIALYGLMPETTLKLQEWQADPTKMSYFTNKALNTASDAKALYLEEEATAAMDGVLSIYKDFSGPDQAQLLTETLANVEPEVIAAHKDWFDLAAIKGAEFNKAKEILPEGYSIEWSEDIEFAPIKLMKDGMQSGLFPTAEAVQDYLDSVITAAELLQNQKANEDLTAAGFYFAEHDGQGMMLKDPLGETVGIFPNEKEAMAAALANKTEYFVSQEMKAQQKKAYDALVKVVQDAPLHDASYWLTYAKNENLIDATTKMAMGLVLSNGDLTSVFASFGWGLAPEMRSKLHQWYMNPALLQEEAAKLKEAVGYWQAFEITKVDMADHIPGYGQKLADVVVILFTDPSTTVATKAEVEGINALVDAQGNINEAIIASNGVVKSLLEQWKTNPAKLAEVLDIVIGADKPVPPDYILQKVPGLQTDWALLVDKVALDYQELLMLYEDKEAMGVLKDNQFDIIKAYDNAHGTYEKTTLMNWRTDPKVLKDMIAEVKYKAKLAEDIRAMLTPFPPTSLSGLNAEGTITALEYSALSALKAYDGYIIAASQVANAPSIALYRQWLTYEGFADKFIPLVNILSPVSSSSQPGTVDQVTNPESVLNIIADTTNYSFADVMAALDQFASMNGESAVVDMLKNANVEVQPTPTLDPWMDHPLHEDDLRAESPFDNVWIDHNKVNHRYGVIIINPKTGKVLLRRVANDYQGYLWDFAGGTPDAEMYQIDTNHYALYAAGHYVGTFFGEQAAKNKLASINTQRAAQGQSQLKVEHPLDIAKKETKEEMGFETTVVGQMATGFYRGKNGDRASLFYVGVTKGEQDTSVFSGPHSETTETRWVSYKEAKALLESNLNVDGKKRTLRTLRALYSMGQEPKAGFANKGSEKAVEFFYKNKFWARFADHPMANSLIKNGQRKLWGELSALDRLKVAVTQQLTYRYPKYSNVALYGMIVDEVKKRKAAFEAWTEKMTGKKFTLSSIKNGNTTVANTGEPLVLRVWHATKYHEGILLDEFADAFKGTGVGGGDTHLGYFTAGSKELASSWTDAKKKTYELYVALKNPKIYDANGQSWSSGYTKTRIEQAIQDGHDGVVFWRLKDANGTGTQLVFFKTSQVKTSELENIGYTHPTNINQARRADSVPNPLTIDEAVAVLEDTFGKEWITKAREDGWISLQESGDKGLVGTFDGNTIRLYLNNIGGASELIGALLHEGRHARLDTILDQSLSRYYADFLKMADVAGSVAEAAMEQTAIAGAEQFGLEHRIGELEGKAKRDEIKRVRAQLKEIDIAFLVQEDLGYYLQQAYLSGKGSGLLTRILNTIKAWFAGTKLGQWLKEKGFGPTLTDEMAVALGMKAAKEAGKEPVPPATSRMYNAMVWHTTPHKWPAEPKFPYGRFRLDKVGKGEGYISYGWGAYFADAEAAGLKYMATIGQQHNTPQMFMRGMDVPESALLKFIEWDRPLAEQHPAFHAALRDPRDGFLFLRIAREAMKTSTPYPSGMDPHTKGTGGAFYAALNKYLWQNFYPSANKKETYKRTSLLLAEYGIQGAHYLDQKSRPHGEGTFMYSIWDQSLLDKMVNVSLRIHKLYTGQVIAQDVHDLMTDQVFEPLPIKKDKRGFGYESTGQTGPVRSAAVVIDELRAEYGSIIDKMIADGKLRVIEGFNGTNKERQASWDGDEIVIYTSATSPASALFLHEGSHAGMKEMLGNAFDNFVQDIENLGTKAALDAKAKAESAANKVGKNSPEWDAVYKEELMAYFVQYTKEDQVGNAGLFRRIINKIKAWFASTDFGQWLKTHGQGLTLTEDLAIELAKRAVTFKTGGKGTKQSTLSLVTRTGTRARVLEDASIQQIRNMIDREREKTPYFFEGVRILQDPRDGTLYAWPASEDLLHRDTAQQVGIDTNKVNIVPLSKIAVDYAQLLEVIAELGGESIEIKTPVFESTGNRAFFSEAEMRQRFLGDEFTLGWWDKFVLGYVDRFSGLGKKDPEIVTEFEQTATKISAAQQEIERKYADPLKQIFVDNPDLDPEEAGKAYAARHVLLDDVNRKLAERASLHFVKRLEKRLKQLGNKPLSLIVGKERTKLMKDSKLSYEERRRKMAELMDKYAAQEPMDNGEQKLRMEWNGFKDHASGFSTGTDPSHNLVGARKAQEVLDTQKNKTGFAEMTALLDALSEAELQARLRGDLITQGEYDRLKADKMFYAPLRREDYAYEMMMHRRGTGVGKGMTVRFGSDSNSEPTLVVQNMLAKTMVAVANAENNLARQYMALQIQADPEAWKDWFTVGEGEQRPMMDKMGFTGHTTKSMPTDKDIAYVVKGKRMLIRPVESNQRAMSFVRAVNNWDAKETSGPMQLMNWANRLIRFMNITASPLFLMMNLVRDPLTAAYNLSATEADGYVKKIFGEYKASLRALRKAALPGADETDPDVQRVRKWEKAGGRISFVQALQEMDVSEFNFEGQVKWERNKIVRAGKQGLNAIERTNMMFENVMRFSAFEVLTRDAKLDEKTAARVSRDMTTNFNRKGYHSAAMGTWWLFFNATVQGNRQVLVNAMKSKKLQGLIAGTVVFSLMVDLLGRALGDDDEDGDGKNDWDAIPAYDKERYWHLPIQVNGAWLKIPAPWVYNVVWRAGQAIGEMASGVEGRDPASAAMDLGRMSLTSLSPIGGGTLLQALAPTALDPVVQIQENKDWTGKPLAPERFPGDSRPANQLAWESLPEGYKYVAQELSGLTGGTQAEGGLLDVQPSTIKVLTDTFLGGLGRFMGMVGGSVWDTVSGEDRKLYQYPIVSQFAVTPRDTIGTQLFHERVGKVMQVDKALRRMTAGPDRNFEEAKLLREKYKDELRMVAYAKDVDTQLKSLRLRIRRAEARGDKDRSEIFKEQMKALQRRFNNTWEKRVG